MTTSPLVPGSYQVALDGHPFVVDLSADGGGFMSASIPMLRNQSDQGARPGEQSLDPDGLWRRSVESWHHGAGQSRADRQASDQYRFRTSLHLNPWERYELTRLNETGFTATGFIQAGDLVVAGERLWYADTADDSLNYADDINPDGTITFTAVPATPWTDPGRIATDGTTIYVPDSTGDVYAVDAASLAITTFATGGPAGIFVRFAKDRLLAFATTAAVYDISAGGAFPSALFTPRTGTWYDAAGGTDQIYMVLFTGPQILNDGLDGAGIVYRTAVTKDGTGLDQPIIAARLPDGEQAYALLGYLGLVFIGTSKGVRVCAEQQSGALIIGPLIEVGGPVLVFEPQGSQVWFSWQSFTDFGDEHSGLGRINLEDYDPSTGAAPPYATDLMPVAATPAIVTGVTTFKNKRVFARVLGDDGIYAEADTQQGYAHLVSGLFNFGLTEPKTFHYLGIGGPLVAPHVVSFVTDTSPYEVDGDPGYDWYDAVSRVNMNLADKSHLLADVDPRPTQNDAIYDLGGRRSNELEYRLLIAGTVNRITLQARPAVTARTEKIQVPLLLSAVDDVEGADLARRVRDELNHIRSLVRRGTPVTFQDGNETYDVIVEDYRFIRTHGQADAQRGDWNGVCVVTLKRHVTVTPAFRSVSTVTAEFDATVTVTAPDGSQAGDLAYLLVAWADAAVVAPAPAGWTLLETNTEAAFASATYWRMGATSAELVFTAPVDSAAIMVAYSQGELLDQTESVVGTLPAGYATPLTATFADTPRAVVTAVAGIIDTDSVLAGPTRPRARVEVAVGGDVLVAEVGDAVSTSKVEVPGSGVVDQINYQVFFAGTVRAYAHRLK